VPIAFGVAANETSNAPVPPASVTAPPEATHVSVSAPEIAQLILAVPVIPVAPETEGVP
jgi:hypothetical protein